MLAEKMYKDFSYKKVLSRNKKSWQKYNVEKTQVYATVKKVKTLKSC